MIAAALILPFSLKPNEAKASEEKDAIATEQNNRDNGWGDFTVVGKMVLKNKAGKESVREFKSMTLEEEDASIGDKSVIVFTKPRDVAERPC